MAQSSAEPATAPSTVTIVTQTRVAPAHNAEFATWQERVDATISKFPGYLDHQIIPPNPPIQVDWVIVQRFDTADHARAWLQSEERTRLVGEIQSRLVGQDDVHLFTDGAGPKLAAPVTAVISMQVKPGQEAAFQEWQRRMAATEATFEGFSGYRFDPPIPGVQDDWVSIIRFDSDAHLEAWLNSDERRKLLEETPQFSGEYHVRKVRTGFESWFAPKTGPDAAPMPAWKINMVVLLVLYPTVFLFGFLIGDPILKNAFGLPFPLILFLGNVASTILLGYWFTRWASNGLSWWLFPKPTASPSVHWIGAALVLGLYLLCILIFVQFPPPPQLFPPRV